MSDKVKSHRHAQERNSPSGLDATGGVVGSGAAEVSREPSAPPPTLRPRSRPKIAEARAPGLRSALGCSRAQLSAAQWRCWSVLAYLVAAAVVSERWAGPKRWTVRRADTTSLLSRVHARALSVFLSRSLSPSRWDLDRGDEKSPRPWCFGNETRRSKTDAPRSST